MSARISTPSFHKKVPGQLPSELAEVLGPIVETIGLLTEKIKDYDRRIEELAAQRCPETELLRQVSGVASLTALTFVGEQCHYILGPFAPDSDLRRHGEKIAQRGGKNAKKRAVVAVARKLSVLLHRLWVSGEVYEALRNARCLGVQAEEGA